MKTLKPFTMQWWQTGIFKVSLISLGIIIGTTWPDFFEPVLNMLIVLALVGSLYILITWTKR